MTSPSNDHVRRVVIACVGLASVIVCCKPHENRSGEANIGRAASALVQPGPVIRDLPLANRDFLDFMISDVCLDINGNVTGGDPGHCATHRDLKVGEAVPYLKRIYSFPIRGLNGTTAIAVWQDTLAANKEASLREFVV